MDFFNAKVGESRPAFCRIVVLPISLRAPTAPALQTNAIRRRRVDEAFVDGSKFFFVQIAVFGDELSTGYGNAEFSAGGFYGEFAGQNAHHTVDVGEDKFKDDLVVLHPVDAALLKLTGRLFQEVTLGFNTIRVGRSSVLHSQEVKGPNEGVSSDSGKSGKERFR